MEYEDIIYRYFLMYFPYYENRILRYYMFTNTELMAELDNGHYVVYDSLHNTCREFSKSNELEDEEHWRLEFARRLYKMMEHQAISQNTLSEISGISIVTISSYMNGKSTPSLYNAEKLARALRCGVEDLIKFPTRR